MADNDLFMPGPWQECGHNRDGCTCGQIWSIPADTPVATAIIGDWGDTVAVLKKEGRKKVAALDMTVYGSIGEATGKANARLIAAAPDLFDALTAIATMLFRRPDMVAALRPLRGPAEDAVFYAAAAALNKARGRVK